ncbi:hypothetical protein ACNKHR_15190 [Shigella flexneri]
MSTIVIFSAALLACSRLADGDKGAIQTASAALTNAFAEAQTRKLHLKKRSAV